MDGAAERDFSDRPRGVVGEVGGQDADPQLALWEEQRASERCYEKRERWDTVCMGLFFSTIFTDLIRIHRLSIYSVYKYHILRSI